MNDEARHSACCRRAAATLPFAHTRHRVLYHHTAAINVHSATPGPVNLRPEQKRLTPASNARFSEAAPAIPESRLQ